MKPSRKRSRFSLLLGLLLDALLLILFTAQALLAGSLLIYGYVPIGQKLGNQLIAKFTPEGVRLEAEKIHLRTNGEIALINLSLWTEGIRLPVLETEGALLHLARDPNKPFSIKPKSLVITNGTFYLPAVYSPDGLRSPILERIALRLIPNESLLKIDSFAARHQDIRFRGGIEAPFPKTTTDSPAGDPNEKIAQLFETIAWALKEKNRFDNFIQPTLAFDLKVREDRSLQVAAGLSSPALKHAEVNARKIRLLADFQISETALTALTPLMIEAEMIEAPKYQLKAESLRASIPQEDWSGLFQGILPQFELTAESLSLHDITLDATRIKIKPETLPHFTFSGTTKSLDGAVAIHGKIDAGNQSGEVRATGNVDLLTLIPKDLAPKLPEIAHDKAPYYELRLDFKAGFSLLAADLRIRTDNFSLQGIEFDYAEANCSFQNGIYSIDDLYLKRDWQWVDLKFSFDNKSWDYKVTLVGSAVPYDYNQLLPDWWGAIFEDFDFSQSVNSLGDFIIYGNAQESTAGLFFGYVRAENVSFKDVFLQNGTLFVRGRGRYAEVHDIQVTSGERWAKGDLAFSSLDDGIAAPVSIRLKFHSQLGLADAKKLFGPNIAVIIDDFQTDAYPETFFEAAIFTQAYPEYEDKTFFNLTVDSKGPIEFKGTPLEDLKFSLYGRNQIIHLRDVTFGYAEGTGTAAIDIRTPPQEPAKIKFKLNLKDAAREQAIRNLPQLDNIEDSLDDGIENTSSGPSKSEEGSINLKLHAQGPINDPYQFEGYGNVFMQSQQLGAIQLLGPLSNLLKKTRFNFTSFNLETMDADFQLIENQLLFSSIQINGPRTRIKALGSMRLATQELNMDVSVSLFANIGDPESTIKKVGNLITTPIPNLLKFQLSGTIKEQKWRSLYDPRNLLPKL